MTKSGGRRWEVERDRFGYFCHPDLEVGECVEVMPVAEHEAEVARLRPVVEALREMRDAEGLTPERIWRVMDALVASEEGQC